MDILYYAISNKMSIDCKEESQHWIAYAFKSRTERDKWLDDNKYCRSTKKYIAKDVGRDFALEIARKNSNLDAENIKIDEDTHELTYIF